MPEHEPDPVDNLQYVRDMLEQLEILAAPGGGPFLSYLLDMAKSEAGERLRAARRQVGSGKE